MTDNIPAVKAGLVAVSRDNFPKSLSQSSAFEISAACRLAGVPVHLCETVVECESDIAPALRELRAEGCNALIVHLGNFGPEAAETMLAAAFDGPVMYAAAAEDSAARMFDARRDAYCGLLNCSYNLGLRGITAYLPPYPVGGAAQTAAMIRDFLPLARAMLGLRGLKLISFGPRPKDFFACNAPIKPLYALGVEIQENSEMDLLVAWEEHAGDPRIPQIVDEMRAHAPQQPDALLRRMAQYEITLLDWAEANRGARPYLAFANKCWPAFSKKFGFLPCYVNARLGAMGYPVGCETDIYGALSEYIGLCITGEPVTLLDINNSVPEDFYADTLSRCGYTKEELFIGFHCGNTPVGLMDTCSVKYKIDRKDPYAAETGAETTRGTLEGPMKPGATTCFRLHASPEGELKAYIARGEILPARVNTYGCYGVFAVPQMHRFYRHVLLEKRFPHHSAIAYGDCGAALFELFKLLGIQDISYNQPYCERYPSENPFLRDGAQL